MMKAQITFDTSKMLKKVKEHIRNKFDTRGIFYVGLSGGKDCAFTAALATEVFGHKRVVGVTMPNVMSLSQINDSDEKIIKAADKIANFCNIDLLVVPVGRAFTSTIADLGCEASEEAIINILPRLRMMNLYLLAQSDKRGGGRVLGTGNLSEILTGYFTKWGDAASDYNTNMMFTCNEIVALCKEIGYSADIYSKVPADDLCGKTDEERLGLSYDSIHRIIRGVELNEVSDYDRDMLTVLNQKARHKISFEVAHFENKLPILNSLIV